MSSVNLYCGPSLLTDSTTIVSDLLEFADSFLLELPEAGDIEIQSEANDVFLLTGSRKKFEAPLQLKKKLQYHVKALLLERRFILTIITWLISLEELL